MTFFSVKRPIDLIQIAAYVPLRLGTESCAVERVAGYGGQGFFGRIHGFTIAPTDKHVVFIVIGMIFDGDFIKMRDFSDGYIEIAFSVFILKTGVFPYLSFAFVIFPSEHFTVYEGNEEFHPEGFETFFHCSLVPLKLIAVSLEH